MTDNKVTKQTIFSIAILLALLIVSLSAVPNPAPVEAQEANNDQFEDRLELTQYELDNGLDVILVEDHSAPTVTVSVWYDVGGADDPENRSGFAHLFEHMMFQGSAHVARGEHAELINAAGGNYNATTGIDRTNYFEALPAHQLPLALWLEAERMRSLQVNEENFEREVEVVKEEYRLRIENQPYGEAQLRLQTMPFDYPPYQDPVIGSIEDLNRATVEEIKKFHQTYYQPANATLAVAGDIDVVQTRELIQRYFGDIAGSGQAPALPTYEYAPQQEAQEVRLEDELARAPATFIAYRMPPRDHPDYYAAEVLARILGLGQSSRLAQALVDTGLAANASAALMGNKGPSLFNVILVPNPDVDPARLEQIYYDELARLRQEGVTPAELEKTINQIRAQKLRQLESTFYLVESVQSANFYLDDPHAVLEELDRYQVTSEDIQRVAADCLGQDSRNVIRVEPTASAASTPAQPAPAQAPGRMIVRLMDRPYDRPLYDWAAVRASSSTVSVTNPGATAVSPPTAHLPLPSFFPAMASDSLELMTAVTPTSRMTTTVRTTPPPPLPVREFTLPDFHQAELDNGLDLLIIPQQKLPLLTLVLLLPGGESAVPPELAGLASMTASMLPRGTETRSAGEISQTIEGAGGLLFGVADRDATIVITTGLSENSEVAFDILSDVALHPTFPEQEVETQRQQELASLQVLQSNPGAVADRVFNKIVYGDNHPYGQLTTEETVKAITRDDLLSYYRSQFQPEEALLIIAGDMASEEALDRAKAWFGGWSNDATTAGVTYPVLTPRTEQTIYLVDRPDATQAELRLGHLGLEGTNENRYAVEVANQVLGASPSSRLFQNLREDKGYTYGISSSFSLPLDRGQFQVSAAVRNDVAQPAVEAILAELERIRSEPVPAKELEAAKSYLVGSYALELERVQILAEQLGILELCGLALSNLADYPRTIEQVDLADVQQAARKYIHPERLAIVVVGPAAQLRDSLAEIAPVVLIDEDGLAHPGGDKREEASSRQPSGDRSGRN